MPDGVGQFAHCNNLPKWNFIRTIDTGPPSLNDLPSRLDIQPSFADVSPILPGHILFDARDESPGILSVLTLQPSGYLDAW